MPDFTSFVVLTAAQLANKFFTLCDWSVSRRHIVRHSREELCSTPASANGQPKVAQPSLDGPSQHLPMRLNGKGAHGGCGRLLAAFAWHTE